MSSNNLTFRHVSEIDLAKIRSFYQSYRGVPESTWNEHCPNEEILQLDYSSGNLYGLYDNNQLIGAISVSDSNHLNDLPCWKYTENAKEIARVVISKMHQGKGYGTIMLNMLWGILKQQGVDAIHLLVSLSNPRAINLYKKFHFENRGKYFLYDHDYYAMEVRI